MKTIYTVSAENSPVRHWFVEAKEIRSVESHYLNPLDTIGFQTQGNTEYELTTGCGQKLRGLTHIIFRSWNDGWDVTCGNCKKIPARRMQ